MNIENNIIKYYPKDVYFITGTACAGKSTTAKALAERYGLVLCGENCHPAVSDKAATPDAQPEISWLNGISGRREFVLRTPEECERRINAVARHFGLMTEERAPV